MKVEQKKRKDKDKDRAPISKVVSSFVTQKTSKKSSLKKDDFSATKNCQSPNFSRGDVSGTMTAANSQKVMTNLRNSPKASLADIKVIIPQKKIIFNDQKPTTKQKIGEKTKDEIKKSLANVIKVYYPGKKSLLDVSMTEITNDYTSHDDNRISRNDFSFLEIVGEGGYGKVWKVEHLKTRKIYAMKEMSKALIIMKKSVDNVNNEKKILQKVQSPFLANIVCAFHDRENLYLTMDFLSGGDLRNHMSERTFSEEQVRFLLANIIISLSHIHAEKIFHRDIKPQNLVFDDSGYLRLTDFGIARKEDDRQSLDASGTPGYMAPEVMCKQLHSFPVDFYALGIIGYELMLGKRPYFGNNRSQIRDAVLSKQHSIKKADIPPKWSLQSADFINKLIQRQPALRLGYKEGVQQLKQHPWFRRYPWTQIENKSIPSPIIRLLNNFTMIQIMETKDQAIMQYKLLHRAEDRLDAFANYNYKSKENFIS